jgi:predicted RNA-binding Zn-ribbon protein involved in translation (DUF1610 family)
VGLQLQHVPYYGTNTPIDECYECGFTGEFECTSKGFTCPKCGNHDAARVSVTRRVCGYLGSPDARPFNAGKQEEVKRRVKHWATGRSVNFATVIPDSDASRLISIVPGGAASGLSGLQRTSVGFLKSVGVVARRQTSQSRGAYCSK